MKGLRRLRPALSASAVTAILAMAMMATVTPVIADTATGPNTTTAPYLLPVASGVDITSVLTVNDPGAADNGYEFVGIPDGLGALSADDDGHDGHDGKDDIVVLANHEIRETAGVVRRHGQKGAFVSRLVIDGETLQVKEGSDLIDPGIRFWDYPSATYVATGARYADGTPQLAAFSRFCSSTLSAPSGLYNKKTKRGFRGQIYLGNEEAGEQGRVFGITTDGEATQLPRLGLSSWENTVPAPNQSDTTLVMGQEDGPGDASQVWAYIGTKEAKGTPVERAGLTNGESHVIDAVNTAVTNDAQWRATYPKGVAAPVTLRAVDWNQAPGPLSAEAKAKGLNLNRVEDGHWDPSNRNDFYFVTTEGGDKDGLGADSRDGGGLWRLSFKNIEEPDLGATLTLLLDGSEPLGFAEPKLNKPDNLVIDRHGNLLLQEDPGGNNHLARVVAYRIKDGAMGIVARFDPALFGPGATADPDRLTTDEESSGIIDAEDVLDESGAFLLDAQIHTTKRLPAGSGPGTVAEYVENGQLLVMTVDSFKKVYRR